MRAFVSTLNPKPKPLNKTMPLVAPVALEDPRCAATGKRTGIVLKEMTAVSNMVPTMTVSPTRMNLHLHQEKREHPKRRPKNLVGHASNSKIPAVANVVTLANLHTVKTIPDLPPKRKAKNLTKTALAVVVAVAVLPEKTLQLLLNPSMRNATTTKPVDAALVMNAAASTLVKLVLSPSKKLTRFATIFKTDVAVSVISAVASTSPLTNSFNF